MNAIKYIKEHGVEKAREELKKLPNSNVTHMTDDARMFIDENNPLLDKFQRSQIKDLICIEELKRLVESVDLVKSYGGIINAKHDVKYLDLDWDYDTPRVTRLKQAIADYESIFSNDCEILDYPEDYTSPNCKKFDERVNSNETK